MEVPISSTRKAFRIKAPFIVAVFSELVAWPRQTFSSNPTLVWAETYTTDLGEGGTVAEAIVLDFTCEVAQSSFSRVLGGFSSQNGGKTPGLPPF